MTHDQSTSTMTVKQLLDQSATTMGERHRLRLEQMTVQSVAHYSTLSSTLSSTLPQRNYRPFALPFAMAASLMFVFWLWWPLKHETTPQSIPVVAVTTTPNAAVPEWVTDTAIPISLLKNMKFYDWLAKQEEKQNRG